MLKKHHKTVTVIVKGNINASPTVLNIIEMLLANNLDVNCICSSCEEEARNFFLRQNVSLFELGCYKGQGLWNKVSGYLKFRKKVWETIFSNQLQETLLWVARIDTAMAMGKGLVSYHFVLGLHELHDKYPFYQKQISFYAKQACKVVVPEYNRAIMLKCWHKLATTPSILPNKPYSHLRTKGIPISDSTAGEIMKNAVKGRKIILYQGALTKDRDLKPIASAVEKLDNGYCFLVMGKDNYGKLEELKKVCSKIVHIPWVVPPAHLEVTSHAHIGIAAYDFDCLNSVYCAPNKIWEYTGFGIPVLCQDIPGLRYTVGVANAGVCVNIQDENQLLEAFKEISLNYDKYKNNASQFYNSVNLENTMRNIISDGC